MSRIRSSRSTVPGRPGARRTSGYRDTVVDSRPPVSGSMPPGQGAGLKAWLDGHRGAAVGAGLAIGAVLGTVTWLATRDPEASVPVTTLPPVGGTPPAVPAAAPPAAAPVQAAPLGRARKTSSFHLRPTEVADSTGPELPTGTVLDLLEQGRLVRDGSPIFRVHTADGRVGWTFVLAAERI